MHIPHEVGDRDGDFDPDCDYCNPATYLGYAVRTDLPEDVLRGQMTIPEWEREQMRLERPQIPRPDFEAEREAMQEAAMHQQERIEAEANWRPRRPSVTHSGIPLTDLLIGLFAAFVMLFVLVILLL